MFNCVEHVAAFSGWWWWPWPLGGELEAPRCPRRVLSLYLHDTVDLLYDALACYDRPSLYARRLVSHTHRAEEATVRGCPRASHGRRKAAHERSFLACRAESMSYGYSHDSGRSEGRG